MRLARAAAKELRQSGQRARERGDDVEARVLDSLLDVAECTASIAGATNRLFRSDSSAALVAAALRAQRQTVVNLLDDDQADDLDAVDQACDVLAELVEHTAALMKALATGEPPEGRAVDALERAALMLMAWGGRRASCAR